MKSNLVRPRPRTTDRSRIEFQIDEFVEVFTRNQKWEAEGWWKATIKNKKGNFFYVAYENPDKYDEIVEKNRLRPINTREALDAREYSQTQILVTEELLEWAKNIEESDRSLSEIRVKSNSLILSFDKERKNIIVVGNDKSIETAKLLIDVVLSHQAEVLRHCTTNEGELLSFDHFAEIVLVDEKVLDLLGGFENAYFKNIKARYKVDLELAVEEPVDGKYKITIIGATERIVQSAKTDLMINILVLPLKEKQLNYLKTKLGELQQKSKIICTAENTIESTLTAVGTEDALKNFRLAVETSLTFASKYHSSDNAQEASKSDYHNESETLETEVEEKSGHKEYFENRAHFEPSFRPQRSRGPRTRGKTSFRYIPKH